MARSSIVAVSRSPGVAEQIFGKSAEVETLQLLREGGANGERKQGQQEYVRSVDQCCRMS